MDFQQNSINIFDTFTRHYFIEQLNLPPHMNTATTKSNHSKKKNIINNFFLTLNYTINWNKLEYSLFLRMPGILQPKTHSFPFTLV